MTRPLNVAVADDEPDLRDYFARMLPALGHRLVGTASSAEELLALCRDARPDLVITDVRMPGGDSLGAAERLRRELGVPVLFVSACHDPEVRRYAGEVPGMGFLVKPVRRAQLELAIGEVMGGLERAGA